MFQTYDRTGSCYNSRNFLMKLKAVIQNILYFNRSWVCDAVA